MPPISRIVLKPEHITAEGFDEFKDMWRELVNQVNILQGVHGPIPLYGDIDMGGNRIKNVGAPASSSDVLTQDSADPIYSTSVQQSAMEAVGTKMLQTTRRLNDGTQQHRISSDLNVQGSLPPSNVTGTLNYTSVIGASITWTWADIVIQLSDLTYIGIPDGSLVITGLANTTYYFYPYYDTLLGMLVFVADNTAAGAPPVAFHSANTAAGQSQTSDTRIALTLSGTTATANGGNGGAALRSR